ncbi:MAG: anti-sigma factor [Actinomycetota bacterium]|nr:anti-sigma factor [Actinomycetota bacterium]
MSDQLEPELERVAQMLAHAGPLPDAPATLRERALAIPEGGAAALASDDAVPVPVPRERRTWRRPRPLVLGGLAATVAAIAIVPAVVLTHRGGGGGVQSIDLVPRSFAPQGGGAARVVEHGDSSTISLTVWKMPSAGSGRTYEAWLGRKGDRRPLGTFSTDANGKATITFRVTSKEYGHYRWLWVTSEPRGGSKQPSGDTALWGPLT